MLCLRQLKVERATSKGHLLKFGLKCRGWELGLLFSRYSMAVLWTNYLMERVLSESILHPMQVYSVYFPHSSYISMLAVSLSGKISFCSFNQLMQWIRNQISIVQVFQHYYTMASSDSWKAVEYLSKVAHNDRHGCGCWQAVPIAKLCALWAGTDRSWEHSPFFTF